MAVVIYYSGPFSEAVQRLAPIGEKSRFCNAKYFSPGEYEAVTIVKRAQVGRQAVHFDRVIIAPRCAQADAIAKTYEELGVEVERAGSLPEKPTLPPSPAEVGWRMRMSPEKYLGKYPNGAKAELAREVLARIGGG